MVSIDDSPHRSQPDAGPGKFLVAVQAPKSRKQLSGVGHVEPGPVIPHEIGHAAIGLCCRAEFNAGSGSPGSKFPRIGQQILQHNAQQRGIASGRDTLGEN